MEKGVAINPEVGVPQGSLVSPLLSNIYLDKLDKHMEDYIRSYSSNNNLVSKVNPKMANLTKKMTKLHMEYRETGNIDILKNLRALRKFRNSLNSRIRTGVRIHYVRYADD